MSRLRPVDPRESRIRLELLEMRAERMRQDSVRANENHAIKLARFAASMRPVRRPIGPAVRGLIYIAILIAVLAFCSLHAMAP